jgi:hypothetical protein
LSQARAIVETLLPAEAGMPAGVETGAVEFLEGFHREAPASMVLAARAAVLFAGWAAPLMILRLPPLSRLSAEDRERALGAMARSNWYIPRQLLLLLKATVSFQYGADPRVRAKIGFPS